jgi:hypothetical protein
MNKLIISIESKKAGVGSVPCYSLSHAKKLLRIVPDRFIKIVKVKR